MRFSNYSTTLVFQLGFYSALEDISAYWAWNFKHVSRLSNWHLAGIRQPRARFNMRASLPENEPDRLRTLESYAILDSPPEPAFDALAELASIVCGTPTGLVTIVDEYRQWFKAKVGFDLSETHRDLSFCAFTIASGRELVVSDAAKDERFRDNPFVTGPPRIRFYAGAPIIVKNGHVLGTVAAIDYAPQTLTDRQIDAMRLLAAVAADHLESRKFLSNAAMRAIRTEQRFSDRAVESIPGIFYVINQQGRFLRWNRFLEEVSGYSQSEVADMIPADFFGAADEPRVTRAIMQGFETGSAQIEAEFRFKDGNTVPFLFTGRRIELEGEPCLLGMGIDISERIRAEKDRETLQAQLMQSQKMESIGRLAGGVAHDFNNMLGVIIGHADLAIEATGVDNPLRENLTELKHAAERSAELTQQLLAFARKQPVQPRVIDLNEIVENVLKMLRRIVGEYVDLRWRPGAGLWPVKIDPAQIEQILTNLCVNARDAIKDTGQVVIETRNAPEVPAPHRRAGEGCVLLSVGDDGCGMDDETCRNIFEPFFSTKGHQGTGLGLATVFGIVKQNEGRIEVSSKEGRGTVFNVHFPRHHGRADAKPQRHHKSTAAGGTETILLVEDEPAVLKIVKVMAERLGYSVLAAGTAHEAIQLSRSHDGPIHLLLTDIVMPERNGPELFAELSRAHSHLRCLYMSGYIPGAETQNTRLPESGEFIPKPFSVKMLAAKIRQVLDN